MLRGNARELGSGGRRPAVGLRARSSCAGAAVSAPKQANGRWNGAEEACCDRSLRLVLRRLQGRRVLLGDNPNDAQGFDCGAGGVWSWYGVCFPNLFLSLLSGLL